MATVVTTNATYLTQPVNYVLMKGLLQAARKKLPYFNGTLPGDLIKNGGSSSVKWERINNLAATTTALGEVVGNSAFLFGRQGRRLIVQVGNGLHTELLVGLPLIAETAVVFHLLFHIAAE